MNTYLVLVYTNVTDSKDRIQKNVKHVKVLHAASPHDEIIVKADHVNCEDGSLVFYYKHIPCFAIVSTQWAWWVLVDEKKE